eukprot:TRINITY_DN31007_c0_g1_i1.p1 TRINITY_DN31007_c0_g1~~TRINITY_DN31007_c0_g1_i1.p1  ORF type:complete len:864 (-),score=163.99 TRINITY_DN31007_c0_g1_i1:73-2664(-)
MPAWNPWGEVMPPLGLVSPARMDWCVEAAKAQVDAKKACFLHRSTSKIGKSSRDDIKKGLDKDFKLVPAVDVVGEIGVPIKVVQDYVSAEGLRDSNCKTLPMTALLLIIYMMVGGMHYEAVKIGSAERAIKADIIENANFAWSKHFGHKGVYDVNSYADFWSWLDLGLMPALYQYGYGVSEGSNLTSVEMPFEDRPHITHHFRPIGGIRMSQVILSETPCVGDKAVLKFIEHTFSTTSCVGFIEALEEEQTERTVIQAGKIEGHPMERIEWLYAHWPKMTLDKRLRELQAGKYVDRHTLQLVLSMATFNTELSLYVVTYVSFRFSRGGAVHKRIDSVGFPSDRYEQGLPMIIVDAIFVLLMLYVAVVEVVAIIRAMCASGCKGLEMYASDAWNIVDWVSLTLFFYLCGYNYYTLRRTWILQDTVMQLDNGKVGSPEYITAVKEIFTELDYMVWSDDTFSLVASIFPVIIMLRLFKSFSAQPRLAVVTNTLYEASGELVHFMIIFLTILLTFSTMAHILFGRDMIEFRDPIPAFGSCFRVMLGDLDFHALVDAGGLVRASVWLTVFIVIMVLQMLNMLLVIVMETYSAVKAQADNMESLASTTTTVVKRLTGRVLGLRVGIVVIEECLVKKVAQLEADSGWSPEEKDTKTNPILTIDDFMDIVPGLQWEQARNIMTFAVLHFRTHSKGSKDAESENLQVQRVNHRTKRMFSLLQLILQHKGASNEASVPRIGAAEIADDLLPRQPFCSEGDFGCDSATLRALPEGCGAVRLDQIVVQDGGTGSYIEDMTPEGIPEASPRDRVQPEVVGLKEAPQGEAVLTEVDDLKDILRELTRIRQNMANMKEDVQRVGSTLEREEACKIWKC